MKLSVLAGLASFLTEDVSAKKMITHEVEVGPKSGGLSRHAEKHDVVTMDIVNHSDLQVMIIVYVGSNQERHKLIVDSGSMVGRTQTNSNHFIVDVDSITQMLQLWLMERLRPVKVDLLEAIIRPRGQTDGNRLRVGLHLRRSRHGQDVPRRE